VIIIAIPLNDLFVNFFIGLPFLFRVKKLRDSLVSTTINIKIYYMYQLSSEFYCLSKRR